MTAPDTTPDDRFLSSFTPLFERIRDEYVQMRAEHYGFADLYAAEFDRALAQHDARIRAEALRDARDALYAGEGPDLVVDADIVYGEWVGNRADRVEGR